MMKSNRDRSSVLLEVAPRAYALGKSTIVWYGGDAFFGRKRCAGTRSCPYAAAMETRSNRQYGELSSTFSDFGASGVRS